MVIVTEKMDGENTTLYCDGLHARSLSSGYHPSRTWVQNWWAGISYRLPPRMRICGENLYARHSIAYAGLPHYFLAFSVWEDETCLSWFDTVEILRSLDVHRVPVLHADTYHEERIRASYRPRMEGYVVRLQESFSAENFSHSVGKFVREGHVTTNDHWMHQEIIPNQLSR